MEQPRQSWDSLRPYKAGDIDHVWANLRPEDMRELKGTPAENPAVLEELFASGVCRVFVWDTEVGPVGMMGVTPTEDPDIGVVWAIGSEDCRSRWRFYARQTVELMDELGRGFKVLANFKDSRNIQQIKWLKRIGFTFINNHPVDEDHSLLEFVRIVK